MNTRSGIAFTGTRQINDAQRDVLPDLLWTLTRNLFDRTLHHGNCLGADVAAHNAACKAWPPFNIVIYPGPVSRWDAGETPNSEGSNCLTRHPRAPYLERNRAIVDAGEVCLAVVDGPERQRSGTWSTARYARRSDIALVILWPDTQVTLEVGSHLWLEPVLTAHMRWAEVQIKEAA